MVSLRVVPQHGAMQLESNLAGPPVTIGVVGPPDLVEGMLTGGPSLVDTAVAVRLVGAAYRAEEEVGPQVRQIAGVVDSLLFAGRWPMDLARRAVDIPVPSTAVPLSGSSLLAVLLKAQRSGDVDIARISVDSLPRDEVRQALADAGVPVGGVLVKEYRGPQTVENFLDWHVSAYRRGRTTAAFTTIGVVARRLQEEGVPAFRVLPSSAAIRTGVSTAALLAVWERTVRTRTAFVLLRASGPARVERKITDEVRLAVHLELLKAAKEVNGAVFPRGDGISFALLTTAEELARHHGALVRAPFVEEIRRSIGVDLDVGIGFGPTVAVAQTRAERGLQELAERGAVRGAAVVDYEDEMRILEAGGADTVPARPVDDPAFTTLLRAVTEGPARAGAAEPPVVHAGQVGEILGVNVRTARRLLGDFVRQGLAWPVPSSGQSGRGRPRNLYRLRESRLDGEAAP